MMDESQNQKDELLERASFGKQIENFWGSRIGGYLRIRAQECYTAAIQELKICDPTNSTLVQRLQGDVRVAEQFEQWLSEAVLDGIKSLELLEGNDDES
jgi:hypothetical protein